ncbi:DUF3299 domain-containing protein [Pseudacidovorax sp. RU35E]|uniref:DUF3299 domain-containing protein n=1 Tax=Pseudacidovorax sp. RU35E TaxID=1907403 RepID=UPI00095421F5|nr:DUF3299 domain-containing protein [Pseudacidovorax sp. RU35E]SIQ60794.1 hypothetical protein SAMN05880557_104423 [Pseudacidovorax sp. RU35E]
MTISRRQALTLCAALAAGHAVPSLAAGPRTIGWDDLIPKAWNPWAEFSSGGVNLKTLSDEDPRARAALQRLRKIWDEAPVVTSLDGTVVRLPGYVVPLEQTAQGMRELLLVPHFGACIHTPPPPANQVVHVVLERPNKSLGTMDTIWVTGRLSAAHAVSTHAASGYRLAGTNVERYAAPRG